RQDHMSTHSTGEYVMHIVQNSLHSSRTSRVLTIVVVDEIRFGAHENDRCVRCMQLQCLHPERDARQVWLLAANVHSQHAQRVWTEEELVRVVVHWLTSKVPHTQGQ